MNARSTGGNRSLLELLVVTLILLVLPLAALSLFALEGYERYLGPELRQKADTVGRGVVRRIERALELGIPVDQLVGVEEYLTPIVRASDDLGFIALHDADGQVLHVAGVSRTEARQVLASGPGEQADSNPLDRIQRHVARVVDLAVPTQSRVDQQQDDVRGDYLTTMHPVMLDGAIAGVLAVGVPLDFLNRLLEEIAFDAAIVLLVGLLVAFELLLLVISTNLTFPLGLARELMADIREGRIGRTIVVPVRNEVGRLLGELNRAVNVIARRQPEAELPAERRPNLVVVRLLAFLFIAAEELARPFLPIYIGGFTGSVEFADEAILIGLPLSLFMLAAALSMAFMGPLFEQLDRRHTFLLGALAATAGLVGTGLAQSYYDLALWRSVAGIGYGLCFVACQGYVFDHAAAAGRAQGISMFVGGIMTADICGPAIGGILADRIGFSPTLFFGAAVALISGLLVYRLMEPTAPQQARRVSLGAGLVATSANWRFWALLLLAAVPAKMVLTGFLFYQVPLYLTELGSSQSEIGRIVMTYGIAAVAITPLIGYWADRTQIHGLLIVAGGILTGIGMIPILFGQSPGHVLLATLALGVGQAMSIPALFVVVTLVARREIDAVGQASVLGVFRLTERIGAAAGPFVVAALLSFTDHANAMAIGGMVAVVSAVIFGTVFMSFGYERDRGLAAPAE